MRAVSFSIVISPSRLECRASTSRPTRAEAPSAGRERSALAGQLATDHGLGDDRAEDSAGGALSLDRIETAGQAHTQDVAPRELDARPRREELPQSVRALQPRLGDADR